MSTTAAHPSARPRVAARRRLAGAIGGFTALALIALPVPAPGLDGAASAAPCRPTVAAGTRTTSRRDFSDITDVPTMELDMAALQTLRMRQQGKYVDMRVIRRG